MAKKFSHQFWRVLSCHLQDQLSFGSPSVRVQASEPALMRVSPVRMYRKRISEAGTLLYQALAYGLSHGAGDVRVCRVFGAHQNCEHINHLGSIACSCASGRTVQVCDVNVVLAAHGRPTL